MKIRELWSAADENELAEFSRAIAIDDLAGALFAVADAPSEEIQAGRKLLKEWATRLGGQLGGGESTAQAKALQEVFFGELGFQCAPEDLGQLPAMQLHRVLASRHGHPLLLSALCIDLGRRVGLAVDAVWRSGALLVRVGGDGGALLDPVGSPLAEAEAEGVAPIPLDELVGRLLKQMINLCAHRNDLVAVYRVLSFACALHPGLPVVCLQRAALAEQLGARAVASDLYQQVAQRFPGTEASAAAIQKVEELHRPALMQ